MKNIFNRIDNFNSNTPLEEGVSFEFVLKIVPDDEEVETVVDSYDIESGKWILRRKNDS